MYTPSKLILQGKVDHVSPKAAYVIVEGRDQDVLVPFPYLKGAMHGDQVTITLLKEQREARKPRGKVVKILKRAQKVLVGTLIKKEGRFFLMPTHKKIPYHFLISDPGKAVLNEGGYKASAQIERYPTQNGFGSVKRVSVLGKSGEYTTETRCIMQEYKLSEGFNDRVRKEVRKIPGALTEEARASRRDFTKLPTFTIDPVDAKDFDDALSIKRISADTYQVGIHIADVTHYVKEGSALDQEAARRGNSTYLIGKCVPMLPERLSNDLCSLNPHVLRPSFSVTVDISLSGKVGAVWIGEGLIHSKHRFTYESAQSIIDKQEGLWVEELLVLDRIAKCLRKKRMEHGAIPFTSSELNFTLDDHQNPVAVKEKPALATHKLVEEFMLLANRVVAKKGKELADRCSLPFLYRQHQPPNIEKLDAFLLFLSHFNLDVAVDLDNLPLFYQQVLKQVAKSPLEHIVQTMAIRTMSQAFYDTSCSAHFGLGFTHYTHFTSPIRRYADLIVHRLLKKYLIKKELSRGEVDYAQIALHVSNCEQVAKEAERSSLNYTAARFMQDKKNQTFQAIVSSVTSWGIYAEIQPYKIEGMIKIAEIGDDYYIFDPKQFCVRGKRSEKVIKLGDTVQVKIKESDIEKKTIDLTLIL